MSLKETFLFACLFVCRNGKVKPQTHMQLHGAPNSQNNFEKKKVEDSNFLISKLGEKLQ